MKILRNLMVVFSISIIVMVQGCGSDTSGALTMTALTSADNGDGTYKVSTSITYAPPDGKSAQGVEITVTATDSSGVPHTGKFTLTSGSNSYNYFVFVPQYSNVSNRVSIVASLGSMTASDSITIPKVTLPALAVPSPTVTFAITAIANDTQLVTFTGGAAPFAVISSVPADISAAISTSSTSGGSIAIKLLNANIAGVATNAFVTLTDSAGGAVPITVSYFK